MNAKRYGAIVSWDCPSCGRSNTQTYQLLQTKVPSFTLNCVGNHFSASGNNGECHASFTVGTIRQSLGELPVVPARTTKDAAMPTGDR